MFTEEIRLEDKEREGLAELFKDYESEVFLTEKEKGDLELATQLRTEGKITTPGKPYEKSDEKEIQTLIDRGTFEFIIYNKEKHGNTRLLRSRLVREIKGKNTLEPYEKSRLVIQGFNDGDKLFILTQAPTIQRSSP